MSFATDYFQYKYNLSYTTAKNYVAGIPAVIIVGVIIWSNLTQRIGKKGLLLLFSGVISSGCYILMYFIKSNGPDHLIVGLIPVFLIGIWFSLFEASFWSSIAIMCPEKTLGVAYGIANTANNLGLALMPLLYGWLNTPPSYESYEASTIVLTIQALVGLFFCAMVYISDIRGTRRLDLPELVDPPVWQKTKKEFEIYAQKNDFESIQQDSIGADIENSGLVLGKGRSGK
jgi:MFS family permease